MKIPSYKIVIPSRYASTRLPGKPLLDIAGKPLVQRVWERALDSGADEVLVATDDQRIAECAIRFGAKAVLTRADHESGTDRLAEVAQLEGWADSTVVVNLQGDEPFMPVSLLDSVAACLAAADGCTVATVAVKQNDHDVLNDPNCVKVVCDANNRALYFSRAPIPYHRDHGGCTSSLQHLGLYAYRAGYLQLFSRTPPTPLEQRERLEQLRALESGESIAVLVTEEDPGIGVDTEADLAAARARFAR